jgi:hypothetical protein
MNTYGTYIAIEVDKWLICLLVSLLEALVERQPQRNYGS